MPTISLFFGIVIRMFRETGAQHNRPHIHAVYQGFEAPFDIETGEILSNAEFPENRQRLSVPGSSSTRMTCWLTGTFC